MNTPIHILIIDDNEDDRMAYRRHLQKISGGFFSISETSDGVAGLSALQGENLPDCILLDYSLPGHNGIEVLKRIRALHPFVPVVMMTGQGNEKVAVDAMQEGAQNYISKSVISPETLDHAIRMAIDHCVLQERIHTQRTSLEVFTRALAHDLKEPLRTIRSFAELISQRESLSEKNKGYFIHIQNAAERMQMLIETVYFYMRLEDPKHMTREPCDAAAIVDAATENLAQLIQEASPAITYDALPQVHANDSQLTQLFQNLIANAIKHGGPRVRIHISAEHGPGQWVFRVQDSGPGIAQEDFQKIFEPFKRLSHDDNTGAGLGLAICKKIIESYEGKIWCESTLGQGTTFLFTLPDALPAAANAPLVAAPVSASSPRKAEQVLANILLVDDSTADVEITKFKILEAPPMQCNLSVASDGRQALAALERGRESGAPFDLMLLDINMPDMDGFEVLERIRKVEHLKDIPVVMCTGSTYDKDIARARALGAQYVVKPVEFKTLVTLIQDAPGVQLSHGDEGYALLRAA